MAMMSTYFRYFILLAVLALANPPDEGAHLTEQGFNATFFKYEFGSDIGWSLEYFKHISESCMGLETVEKVVDMNFHFSPHAINQKFHETYRSRQKVTNMGIRLTSFFMPHDSGWYTFGLAADDGAQLTIGPIRWPCEHEEKIETHKLEALRAFGDRTELGINRTRVYLIKDYYYPVEVIAFNSQGDASLELSVTDPRGVDFADFGCLVYQGTFDECVSSSKASSNSVFADARIPAKGSPTHLQAALPPVLSKLATREIHPDHGNGYEESGLSEDKSGQRSFGSTNSVVNAQFGNTEHSESKDSMVLEKPIIAAKYFDSWGFNIDEYKYSYGSEQGWKPNYFTSPRTGEKTQSLKNIEFINYDSQHPENREYSSRYGSRPKRSEFGAEMSAHFKAPISGTYTFELMGHDGAYMSLGPAEIPCGRGERAVQRMFEMTALTAVPRYRDRQKTKPVTSRGSITLLEDRYYPVKVITFNSQDSSSLRLSVTYPSGLEIPDLGNLVFQARGECGPLKKTMPNWPSEAHDTSAETQNGKTPRLSVQSHAFYMPDNSVSIMKVEFSSSNNKSEDIDQVIVQDEPRNNGVHVRVYNSTDKSWREVKEVSVKVPNTIQIQDPAPDPLSPSELAASGETEAKAKPIRQLRDTIDPKKLIEAQPMLEKDRSTQESAAPQALSEFPNSEVLQMTSKVMNQEVSKKNETEPGIVENLSKAATPKKNDTKPGASEKSSKAATPKKNGTKPGFVENLSKAVTPKKNEMKPGASGKSSKAATPKKNDTKPGASEKSSKAATPKKNGTKPGFVENLSKAVTPKKNEMKPGASGKSSKAATPKKNGTKPGFVENLSKAVTPKKNEMKPGASGKSSKAATPKKNDTKPGASEKSSKAATPKKNGTKPGFVENLSKAVTPKKNEMKPGASGKSSKAATPKKNDTKPDATGKSSKEVTPDDPKKSGPKPDDPQVSSEVMNQEAPKKNETELGVGKILPISATPKKNDTRPAVAQKSSKEPTPDGSETRSPKTEVPKMLSEVATANISDKNDRKSLDVVSQKLPEENDPKREISEKPSNAMKNEILNEKDADSVVSEKSAKIVITDDLRKTGATEGTLQDSLKESNPDAVTEQNPTPDVLEAELRELEPHDQKLDDVAVELNPLLNEERAPDVSAQKASETPLVLVSGNLTAATSIVQAPAYLNNSTSEEMNASPPFASDLSLKVDPAGLDLTTIPEVESADSPIIAIENIPADAGSGIPAPEAREVPALLSSAAPAYSNYSMPVKSVAQMPRPSETIAGPVSANMTSTYRFDKVAVITEEPRSDNSNERMRATILSEALTVSNEPSPFAPEEILQETTVEVSQGIAGISSTYRPEEALSSLLNDSVTETLRRFRKAVAVEPLLAAPQNSSTVLDNLESSVIANDTLPVVAIDAVPETPAIKVPIFSTAASLEFKPGASAEPLPSIACNGSMSGPTRFQKAKPESVKQVPHGTNSTVTSHSAHGTQVEAFSDDSEVVPDKVRTPEAIGDKWLHRNESSVQVQKKLYSQFDQPDLSDDDAQMNTAHGKSGGVVYHVVPNAEIETGNPASLTLHVSSDPREHTSSITKENLPGDKKPSIPKPSIPKPLETGTLAPVRGCLGNNCSSEDAFHSANAFPNIKGHGLEAASTNPRMMTILGHASSAYLSSMPSAEPVRVIVFSDAGSKKTEMLVLGAIVLEVMIMIM